MKRLHRIKTLLSFYVLLFLTLPVFSAVIQVPNDYTTIAEGMDQAVDGDTVLVMDGTYQGAGNTNLDFNGKGITVASVNGPDTCIIDCETSGNGFNFTSGESRDSVLDGFTIRNGYNEFGGGLYCYGSSPRITHCKLVQNQSTGDDFDLGGGGGIYCYDSNPELISCDISQNHAVYGGGISAILSSPTIFDCRIRDNFGDKDGGGIFVLLTNGITLVHLVNSHVSGNSANAGGGMFCWSDTILIENCLITKNISSVDGSAIRAGENSNIALRNCTITGNLGVSINVFYTSYLSARNTILWDIILADDESTLAIKYTDVMGGYPGKGNLDIDPMFVSGLEGNYYLSYTDTGHPDSSPCRDTGKNNAYSTCIEVPWMRFCLSDLSTRTDQVQDDGIVDLGFHYSQYSESTPTPTPTYPPTSTPTPDPDADILVDVLLNSAVFEAGDPFELRVSYQGYPGVEADLFVVLDIHSEYFFWPEWTHEPCYKRIVIDSEEVTWLSIMDFIWPAGNFGQMEGMKFWGLMMEPESENLLSNIDTVSFAFR